MNDSVGRGTATATHLLRGDRPADIRDVQAVLGHQSLTSTSVYLPHSDLPRLRKVLEGRWYGNQSQIKNGRNPADT